MNWEAIAAIGQMLGSIAVFVSLWHLAAQIRESSKLTRYQIDLERYRTLWAPDASDSMIETWAKVSRAGGGPAFTNALIADAAQVDARSAAPTWFDVGRWQTDAVDALLAGGKLPSSRIMRCAGRS
jgi:hypothetical protein